MSHRNDHTDDDRRTDGSGDPLGLSEDLEESFGMYEDFSNFGASLSNNELSEGSDPEYDLLTDDTNKKSLTEQAKKDTEMVKNGTLGGAQIDLRDRAVPIVMWLLLGSAFVIGTETMIDYAGPSAGPIWDFNQFISYNVWLPLVEFSTELTATVAPIFEQNLLVAGVLAVVGILILRNRRR